MKDLIPQLKEKFARLSDRESLDHPALNLGAAEDLLPLCECLLKQFGFDLLVDISGVDWNEQSPRFSVVYHVYSTTDHNYLRFVLDCPDDAQPEVPSVAGVWPTADWHERETFDMFGIRFSGHPDLRRILMWEDYPYFPLRKDFPLAGIETELPDAETNEELKAGVISAPMMGGPFTAPNNSFLSKSEPRAKDQSWSEKKPKPN